MLNVLGLQSLEYRRNFHMSTFMFRALNGYNKCERIVSLFIYLSDTRDVVTRSATNRDLIVKPTRTLFGRKAEVHGQDH